MRQEVRWTDLTYEQIAEHLAEAGTPVSVPVVKQLLKKHGYETVFDHGGFIVLHSPGVSAPVAGSAERAG